MEKEINELPPSEAGACQLTRASVVVVVAAMTGAVMVLGRSPSVYLVLFSETEPVVLAALTAATVNSTSAPLLSPVTSIDVAVPAADTDLLELTSLTKYELISNPPLFEVGIAIQETVTFLTPVTTVGVRGACGAVLGTAVNVSLDQVLSSRSALTAFTCTMYVVPPSSLSKVIFVFCSPSTVSLAAVVPLTCFLIRTPYATAPETASQEISRVPLPYACVVPALITMFAGADGAAA